MRKETSRLAFQHCGLMRDTNEDIDSNLMWYPPEPFFSHPIAKAAAEQMENKEVLKVIPPSHHHTHDYVLHKGGGHVCGGWGSAVRN